MLDSVLLPIGRPSADVFSSVRVTTRTPRTVGLEHPLLAFASCVRTAGVSRLRPRLSVRIARLVGWDI